MKYLSRLSQLFVICFFMTIMACSPLKPVNQPIEHWDKDKDKIALDHLMEGRSEDMVVLLAFSGGGTRAAAFAYGVLQVLAETKVMTRTGEKVLLDEIDAISSVSGGSFTSAYYGLFGDRIFDDFEKRFLRKNVEGDLIKLALNPFYWIRRISPSYGKADLIADYYDNTIFDKATYGDLPKKDRPVIIINSTDLSSGGRFPFTQTSFDMICADFSSYPVARAVAASSAVPVIFHPITLKNYAGQCGYTPPDWLDDAVQDQDNLSRKQKAKTLNRYLSQEKQPWFHLVDGGISDNLGLREFFDIVNLMGDTEHANRPVFHSKPRQVLIISVNSLAQPEASWSLVPDAPSIAATIGSVSAAQISHYSTDTIDIISHYYENWALQSTTSERPVTFNFVNVSFDAIQDKTENEYLNNIGTSFDLTDKEVDTLINSAHKILRESQDFQHFLEQNRSLKY